MAHICLQCGIGFDRVEHLQQHLPLCSTNTAKFKVKSKILWSAVQENLSARSAPPASVTSCTLICTCLRAISQMPRRLTTSVWFNWTHTLCSNSLFLVNAFLCQCFTLTNKLLGVPNDRAYLFNAHSLLVLCAEVLSQKVYTIEYYV